MMMIQSCDIRATSVLALLTCKKKNLNTASQSTTIHPKWYASPAGIIALQSLVAIITSITLRLFGSIQYQSWPLFAAYALGGVPLVFTLVKKAFHKEFGSDLLAGISIITSLLLHEYLAGAFVILMLSGGEALEAYALRRASSVLDALANRMPRLALRRKADLTTEEIDINEIKIGEILEVIPHDICPVDGEVIEGTGSMDESFLTGEPYAVQKTPGSKVISGAMNYESVLIIKATALAIDSRYQKIAQVIEQQATAQVPMRRMADKLGGWYTPLAMSIAVIAWIVSHDPLRFLSVLVVATPCPLLIAIPIALIGTISSASARGIIIKNPSALEYLARCKTMIMDKTGTLTYGKPVITEIETIGTANADATLALVASLERYSKHPLAASIVTAATDKKLTLKDVKEISEKPGQGLTGICDGQTIQVTSRSKLSKENITTLPPRKSGLECIAVVNGSAALVIHFRDVPRRESRNFVEHLAKQHGITKIKILSGDRIAEALDLGAQVGIHDIEGDLSPEDKLARIQAETKAATTVYIGDGINDAPALQAATVGIAIGTQSDITSEAADAVIMDPSLEKVDELLHLSRRLRRIALESALGGMSLSILGMTAASFGLLTPLAGAILQEVIDIIAVLNSLRTSFPEQILHDNLQS